MASEATSGRRRAADERGCESAGPLRALVARAREGDREAFGRLVERHRDGLIRRAYAALANADDAEEVAQETFVQAWRELASLRDPGRFAAWLYRIAWTRASNFRTRWRQETLPLDGVAVPRHDVVDGAARREAREVRDALGALSEPNRQAASLFYLDGHTVEEVAALLGVPAGTVKRRLHDSRAQLRRRLAGTAVVLGRSRRPRFLPLLPVLPSGVAPVAPVAPPPVTESEEVPPMDLTVSQETFARSLARLGCFGGPDAAAAPEEAALRLTESVCFTGEGARLEIARCRGAVRLTTAIAAEVATAGRVVVPGNLLAEAAVVPGYGDRRPRRPRGIRLRVATAPLGDRGLTLDTAVWRLRVGGGVGAGFQTGPTLPDGASPAAAAPESSRLELPAGELRGALARVVPAAGRSADARRPIPNGMRFAREAGGLTLSATDGFRIAIAAVSVPVPTGARGAGERGVIGPPGRRVVGVVGMVVPRYAAAELLRLLETVPEAAPARLVWADDGGALLASVGDVGLSARASRGEYPRVDGVLPQTWRTRVTVETGPLRAATHAISRFGRLHPVLLDATTARLRLYAPGEVHGNAEAELGATLEGAAGRVVLSSGLLLPFLDAATGPRLELSWTGLHDPVLIREAGQGTPATRWVIQPMQAPRVEAHVFA